MARGDPKIIIQGEEARAGLLEGARKVYEAVAATYGPTSGNVAIQRSYGNATITHDGVSVAREVYLANEVEDTGAGLLVEASKKSNDVSGDGTSATVILAYHIMEKARQRIAGGYNAMGLRRGIDKAALWIKDELSMQATPVADKDLVKVASISAGDAAIGALVASTIAKTGGVGVTVEEYEGLGVLQDVVDGLYFEKGMALPHFVTDRATEEAVHENVSVLLLEKRIKQNHDIVPIINTTWKDTDNKTLLIIGNLDGEALETCALTYQLSGNRQDGKQGIKICVVRPPVYGDQELPFLEDVAAMTGGQVIPKSLPADKFSVKMLGSAQKVIVSQDSTTILGGKAIEEDVKMRIANIKTQLKSDKYSNFQKERMEFRLAKLHGKIGIIKVGGATEAEQKEMKFRVEDAVHATRAAKEEGIVPGGAVTLARLSASDVLVNKFQEDKDEDEGFKLVLEALAEPFKRLIGNAGEDGGYRYRQVLAAKDGYGFDVKHMSAEPVDLVKAGVIDPVKVLKSVVENACSVAGLAITIPVVMVNDRHYQLEQVGLTKATRGLE